MRALTGSRSGNMHADDANSLRGDDDSKLDRCAPTFIISFALAHAGSQAKLFNIEETVRYSGLSGIMPSNIYVLETSRRL
jgi:hypothetical protein